MVFSITPPRKVFPLPNWKYLESFQRLENGAGILKGLCEVLSGPGQVVCMLPRNVAVSSVFILNGVSANAASQPDLLIG